MSMFSYHIVHLSLSRAFRVMMQPLTSDKCKGLIHAETMSAMTLGSPVYSPSRAFSTRICVFAQWENEEALNRFLENDRLGNTLSEGWYIKLKFLRKWGGISGFQIPETETASEQLSEPVVAVTIARMKYLEVPRFIRWGIPVERLVRDHAGAIRSLASIRYPNVISTFTVWRNLTEMIEMVQGHSRMPQPKRHIQAMKERDRRNFHYEFTTLRFSPISEHGIYVE